MTHPLMVRTPAVTTTTIVTDVDIRCQPCRDESPLPSSRRWT